MTSSYAEILQQIEKQLAAAMLDKENGLRERIADFDVDLLTMLRSVGKSVMKEVAGTLAEREVAAARTEGFTVEKRDTSFFYSLRSYRNQSHTPPEPENENQRQADAKHVKIISPRPELCGRARAHRLWRRRILRASSETIC